MTTLGIIPARAGSKTIPHKNTVSLDGKPLIWYIIQSARKARLDSLICSTNDEKVKKICEKFEIGVHWRSEVLSGDDVPVEKVVRHILMEMKEVPEIVVLLQPTSPFTMPFHIDLVVEMLKGSRFLNSTQTITEFPHNYHAFNQRYLDERGMTGFVFEEERKNCYNKQKKPKYFCFGNVLAVKSDAVLQGKGLFADPSQGFIIEPEFALDVDGPYDLDVAEWYLETGRIEI